VLVDAGGPSCDKDVLPSAVLIGRCVMPPGVFASQVLADAGGPSCDKDVCGVGPAQCANGRRLAAYGQVTGMPPTLYFLYYILSLLYILSTIYCPYIVSTFIIHSKFSMFIRHSINIHSTFIEHSFNMHSTFNAAAGEVGESGRQYATKGRVLCCLTTFIQFSFNIFQHL
jgi:hypothetical protein